MPNLLIVAAVTSGLAHAGKRPVATDAWVEVASDALLCTRADGQGQCVRFNQPGAQPEIGGGARVFRVVKQADAQVELQAQYAPRLASCGVLPARITPLTLRLFVQEAATRPLSDDASCIDAAAAQQPGPGRDPLAREQAVAWVDDGAWAWWPDGALAGHVRQELWLQDHHGVYSQDGRVCATFDLGPDDGGAVADRALDVCFDPGEVTQR